VAQLCMRHAWLASRRVQDYLTPILPLIHEDRAL